MNSGFLDLTNPNEQSSGFLQDISGNTLLFSLTNVLGGSGKTAAFLRLKAEQGSEVEKGYNTDGLKEFDTQHQGTKAIHLSDLPALMIDNVTYYEFRIDLNESSSHSQIDLRKLKIFQSNVSDLTGYDETTDQLAGLNPVIDLSETVKLNAGLNSGSGRGDVLVYLPASAFTNDAYLYTYVEFQGADSGFEELSYGKTTPLGSLADLSLSQTLSDSAIFVGDTVTFTLTLNNDGPHTAAGIKVQDILPAGFDFTQITPSQGTYNRDTGLWKVGHVASGHQATLTLTGTALEADHKADYTNVAEIIAAKPFDPDSTVNNGDSSEDDYSSVQVPVINLELHKEFTSVTQEVDGDKNGTPEQFLALPGDEVQFTITVTNNGVCPATDVVIQDDLTQVLPVGLTVQSLGLDGGINLDSTEEGDGKIQTLEVLFENIDPGTSKTITVNAKVSDDYITPIKFSGKIGSDNPNTGQLNSSLPEYYETTFDGTLFLNYNIQKEVGDSIANFGFINLTNEAEIVSVNQQILAPGSITAGARLDVSSSTVQGTLGNGEKFQIYAIENLLQPSDSDTALSLSPNPIISYPSKGYPYYNHSQFLPLGTTGIAGFFAEWIKSNDPEYLAKLEEWMNLSADGDLSSTQDEQVIIEALADFIENGVYQRNQYAGGSFDFNNQTETQNLSFEGSEFHPTGTDFVNVLVTDTNATVTNSNNQVIGSFTDLQTALDCLDFTDPTAVKITLKDASGDGVVKTRLQELNGFNFKHKWYVENITIDASTTDVIFSSKNQSSDLNLSFQTFQMNETQPQIKILGDNAKDQIVGSLFSDIINGMNGNDGLEGSDGDDVINGERGQDTLNGGRGNDQLTGGSASDTFIFGGNFGNDIITDYTHHDVLDFHKLSLGSSALDSNQDGVINALDDHAGIINSSLLIDLTSFQGGTLTLTNVTSVKMSAVIL
jgi:uncharacterized repeat protein (TIGR01451 family)